MKKKKIEILEKNIIAVCGLDCRLCPVFEANIEQRQLQKNPELYKTVCLGCRVERAVELSEKGRSSCAIYNCCVKNKKKKFCYQCEMFPCKMLSLKSESKASVNNWLQYYSKAAPP